MDVTLEQLFREAMSHFASGVAVPRGVGRARAGGNVGLPALPARGELHALRPAVLIGDLEGGRLEPGEPLVYARRRMDWLMQPMR